MEKLEAAHNLFGRGGGVFPGFPFSNLLFFVSPGQISTDKPKYCADTTESMDAISDFFGHSFSDGKILRVRHEKYVNKYTQSAPPA